MADERIAIYVYKTTSITIDPGTATIDVMVMQSDFTAALHKTLTAAPDTQTFTPGVYGFVFNGVHGVTADPGVVTLVLDLYGKHPWPQMPPPPPSIFSNRSDWDDHRSVFLVPLGATFDLGASQSSDGT